jgi:hypothetical protein
MFINFLLGYMDLNPSETVLHKLQTPELRPKRPKLISFTPHFWPPYFSHKGSDTGSSTSEIRFESVETCI